jgi:hypothetical protein
MRARGRPPSAIARRAGERAGRRRGWNCQRALCLTRPVPGRAGAQTLLGATLMEAAAEARPATRPRRPRGCRATRRRDPAQVTRIVVRLSLEGVDLERRRLGGG